MEDLNCFQAEFMKTLADIQEHCVRTALCQDDESTLENKFYQLSSDVIIRIMEMIDGYANPNIGSLKVICEKNSMVLKEHPYIELHDKVCDYLKDTE